MKKLFLFIAFASIATAQIYQVRKNTTLAGAAEVITIQQPASGSRQVTFISAYFDCSVACNFTLERSGTAASATSLTVNNANAGETAPATTAWSGSNVGGGTVLASFGCTNACNVAIDLTGITFAQGTGTGTNLTLRSSSITGTVNIFFKYSEKTL